METLVGHALQDTKQRRNSPCTQVFCTKNLGQHVNCKIMQNLVYVLNNISDLNSTQRVGLLGIMSNSKILGNWTKVPHLQIEFCVLRFLCQGCEQISTSFFKRCRRLKKKMWYEQIFRSLIGQRLLSFLELCSIKQGTSFNNFIILCEVVTQKNKNKIKNEYVHTRALLRLHLKFVYPVQILEQLPFYSYTRKGALFTSYN